MPTIRRCCIIGCVSNSRQNPQLQFFQFPRPENPFHPLWKQACHASLSRILPFKKPVVCALHFQPNNIGGRRLISSAVPSLRLEVPTNLKAVEQQAMVEEIERSRKCAYINAVVYEWLVRANLNPQLRGSITHGMIKEKAETAKQVIGAPSFVADNRWLNRFRETHLTGFAHKLATNQLRPSGPSLWIPDIVQDLQHLFPPTSADRLSNFENVPEQYYGYMQLQYGEYEDDEEEPPPPHPSHTQQPPARESPPQHHHHLQQQQIPLPPQHAHHAHLQQQHPHLPPPLPPSLPNPHHQQSPHMQAVPSPQPNTYEQHNYNYDDFYYHRHHSTDEYPPNVPRPSSALQSTPKMQPPFHHHHQHHQQQPQQQQPQEHPHQRSKSASPYLNAVKRPRIDDDDEVTVVNGAATEQIEDLTDNELPSSEKLKGSDTLNGAATSDDAVASSNGHASPKFTNGNGHPTADGGSESNGHVSTPPLLPQFVDKELKSYAQALEYLKPLEDFALCKENFRAIGLISQLEVILRKGERMTRADNMQH